MADIDLLRSLAVAFSTIGAALKDITRVYEEALATGKPEAKAAPSAKDASRPKKAGKRLLKRPKRKVDEADYAAVAATRKETGVTTWSEARDALCRERGLTRRQVNGILMTIGQDAATAESKEKAKASGKRLPKEPVRKVNDIDRAAAIRLRKNTSDEAWPAACDALCRERGLTHHQVGGILGTEHKRENGTRIGRPKAKA